MMSKRVLTLSQGQELGFAEYGAPESERVLVYFHGLPGSRLEGVLCDSAAKRLTIRVIALDRPGFGLSAPSPKQTISDIALIVGEAMTALSVDKFSVLALSGGAPYALACCAELGGRVEAATIVSGMGELCPKEGIFLPDSLVWMNRFILSAGIRSPRTTRFFLRILANTWKVCPFLMTAYFSILLSAGDKAALRRTDTQQLMLASMQEALRQGAAGAVAEVERLCKQWKVSFSKIQQEVVFFHGDADSYVPIDYVRPLVAQIANAKLNGISGGGHFMVLDCIDRVVTELFSKAWPAG